MQTPCVLRARSAILESFRWEQGHADLWQVLRQPEALRLVVRALAEPFRHAEVTAVIGIEARGFLLAGAVAIELGTGFVAVRKAGALFPGAKLSTTTAADYRGTRHQLSLRCDDLHVGERALLVDDWVETGSQAVAVQNLVTDNDAELVGLAVIVDDLRERPRAGLPPVHALLTSDELPVCPAATHR